MRDILRSRARASRRHVRTRLEPSGDAGSTTSLIVRDRYDGHSLVEQLGRAAPRVPSTCAHPDRTSARRARATRGLVASAVATESRRCSPPESVKGFAPSRASSRNLAARYSTRSVNSAWGIRNARGPTDNSSRTVAATNWCSGSWNTVPMRVSSCRDFQRIGFVVASPSTSPSASTSPAAAGEQAPEREAECRLAGAVRACDCERLARAHVPGRCRSRPRAREPAQSDSRARPETVLAQPPSTVSARRVQSSGTQTPAQRAMPPNARARRAREPSARTPHPATRTITRSTRSRHTLDAVLDHYERAPVGSPLPARRHPAPRRLPPDRDWPSARRAATDPGRIASTPASARRCFCPPRAC